MTAQSGKHDGLLVCPHAWQGRTHNWDAWVEGVPHSKQQTVAAQPMCQEEQQIPLGGEKAKSQRGHFSGHRAVREGERGAAVV